ncbi:hypothetical protein RM437_06530 [Citrobacter werkmanii]|uniref:hypothetical protein n=1 Tax=Citrobacter werkmanii TaxID=67827 RepID=UPI002884964F|nr:hypothetical protein [Citrobacter werkmanii]MDT0637688.1 hypothetical protein [Citrobacter werkmanii]
MTPDQAKIKQREDARRRSQQAPRRASSQAVSNEQSEITEEAPAVYRVPQINVPEDLPGVARLIQSELAKIEQSQTILLSLWEKVKDQINTDDAIEMGKNLKIMGGHSEFFYRDPATQSAYIGWHDPSASGNQAYFGYPDTGYDMEWYNGIGTSFINASGDVRLRAGLGGAGAVEIEADQNTASVLTINGITSTYGYENMLVSYQMQGVLRWNCGPYLGNWSINYYDNTGAWVLEALRLDNGTGQMYAYGYMMARASTVEAQINMSIALTREELKAEVYAELLALNPGIVIPKTD